jgi:hypothetical protein
LPSHLLKGLDTACLENKGARVTTSWRAAGCCQRASKTACSPSHLLSGLPSACRENEGARLTTSGRAAGCCQTADERSGYALSLTRRRVFGVSTRWLAETCRSWPDPAAGAAAPRCRDTGCALSLTRRRSNRRVEREDPEIAPKSQRLRHAATARGASHCLPSHLLEGDVSACHVARCPKLTTSARTAGSCPGTGGGAALPSHLLCGLDTACLEKGAPK